MKDPVWASSWGKSGVSVLGVGAWLISASGPFLPLRAEPGATNPALLGGFGGGQTQTQRNFLL